MSSSSLPAEQRIWLLNKAPTGELNADTFRLETRSLPALKDGEIMLKIDYLSNDPIQRLWISPSGGVSACGSAWQWRRPGLTLRSSKRACR